MRAAAMGPIAKLELKIQLRNRWMIGFGALFAALVVGVSYYGLTFLGYEAEFQDFYRTTVTMLNLALIIIPVVALVSGGQSLCGEPGYFEVLASQPVSRTDILLGKVAGIFIALTVMTAVGFGLGGVIVALKTESEGIWRYFVFVGVSISLGLVFVSLSAAMSILAHRKPMAIVTGLILWFFFLVVYDFLVLSISYYIEEAYLRTMLYFSLMGNPIDLARVIVLMAVGGEAALGAAGAGLLRMFGGTFTSAIAAIALLIIWIAAPLAVAATAFRRQDIT
ncbi:MAG: ABC transporter permease subunit [Thermodesulfobacteriota bacterium]